MPFPLIALLTAAASDMQQRSQYGDQVQKLGHDTEQNILNARARQLGAEPYTQMAQDGQNRLEELRRGADASRNNNIGALLQAYLKQKKPTEAAGLGDADAGLAEGWEDDPWGAGGF